MLNLRKTATCGVLALALALGGAVIAPAEDASASAPISGQVSQYLRQYSTWRLKAPGGGISFNGSVSKISCCAGVTMPWAAGSTWTMGLRNPSGTQFSSVAFAPYAVNAGFPGTYGVTYRMEFAINTKTASMPSSDAVASFSGTLYY